MFLTTAGRKILTSSFFFFFSFFLLLLLLSLLSFNAFFQVFNKVSHSFCHYVAQFNRQMEQYGEDPVNVNRDT